MNFEDDMAYINSTKGIEVVSAEDLDRISGVVRWLEEHIAKEEHVKESNKAHPDISDLYKL